MSKFRELVGIAIGEASMCWSEVPSGVFDSERASRIVDKLVAEYEKIDRKERVEAQLLGLTEAMRPLLNEWSELNKEREK